MHQSGDNHSESSARFDGLKHWGHALTTLSPIVAPQNLPNYGFQFFFRNMGPFRPMFLVLTILQIVATLLRFLTVYLLSRIVSNIDTLTIADVTGRYLPLWLSAMFFSECCGFINRRYAEALPTIYSDWITLRFYLTFLSLRFQRLHNFSKERLDSLISRYTGHVRAFLADWTWNTTTHATRVVVVIAILFVQNPWVLLADLIAFAIFLTLSLRISRQFAPIANSYSEQLFDSDTTFRSLTLNLNTVRRLGLRDFFTAVARRCFSANWSCLDRVRTFHAERWFLQLNLYNIVYAATLGIALIQVKQGTLPLGFLILIKWAFDQLWEILVYVIEYYVSLVQQREDAAIIRREFSTLVEDPASNGTDNVPSISSQSWNELRMISAKATFMRTDRNGHVKPLQIYIPALCIKRGQKIGIVGPSGAGKTTLLNMLSNLIEFEGEYRIDAADMRRRYLPPEWITVVTNNDPLFKLTLRDNLLLGKQVDPERLDTLLRGLEITTFNPDLDLRIGDPRFNLSAGQEQRIRLARGALQESEIYLLDEPFNGIDEDTKRSISKFLKTLWAEKTVILITHNEHELALVDDVYSMLGGRLSHRGRPVAGSGATAA